MLIKCLLIKCMLIKCLLIKCVLDKVCGDKVCVEKVFVDKVYGDKVWRRAEEEKAAEEEPGIQNQKQEPHTKMWGKTDLFVYHPLHMRTCLEFKFVPTLFLAQKVCTPL